DIDRFGLGRLLGNLLGTDAGVEGVARADAFGAILSNTVNNLPAYVAGEAVVTNSDQLLGLLIATNVSSLVTPWASLAIILWYERCRSAGVRIAWGQVRGDGRRHRCGHSDRGGRRVVAQRGIRRGTRARHTGHQSTTRGGARG
ncbi:MAG TPA: hypothetical protein VIY28_04795, partial [Pseudonocardiaceae bacterium]